MRWKARATACIPLVLVPLNLLSRYVSLQCVDLRHLVRTHALSCFHAHTRERMLMIVLWRELPSIRYTVRFSAIVLSVCLFFTILSVYALLLRTCNLISANNDPRIFQCYIVATCDRDLKRRIRRIPGVPIMYIRDHQYRYAATAQRVWLICYHMYCLVLFCSASSDYKLY